MIKKILIALIAILILIAILYADFFKFYSLQAEPTNGEYSDASLLVESVERNYNYYTPDNLDTNPALLFVFHGSNRDSDDIREQTGYQFDYLANDNNFITVYPTGYKAHWNGCRASAKYAANTDNINDPAFVSAMIQYFAKKYKIDSDRVFAVGLSNGGQLVYRLAYEYPAMFAGFATIAASPPTNDNFDCIKSKDPVSIIMINGTQDLVNPYHGGAVDVYGDTSRGSVISAKENLEYWRNLANLDKRKDLLKADMKDTEVIETRWTSDSADQQVSLVTFTNSGHLVPSKKVKSPRIMGPNPAELEASQLIWDFFFTQKKSK